MVEERPDTWGGSSVSMGSAVAVVVVDSLDWTATCAAAVGVMADPALRRRNALPPLDEYLLDSKSTHAAHAQTAQRRMRYVRDQSGRKKMSHMAKDFENVPSCVGG